MSQTQNSAPIDISDQGEAPAVAQAEEGRRQSLLHYSNYRVQIWKPFLAKLGIEGITPHSARHSFISTLQVAGIEVATVAKLAGHANPTTTLSVYSHAVKRGDAAAKALEGAYASPPRYIPI